MFLMVYVMQMLPLLKKSIDNLLAVVGDKATSEKSFDVLKCVPGCLPLLMSILILFS